MTATAVDAAGGETPLPELHAAVIAWAFELQRQIRDGGIPSRQMRSLSPDGQVWVRATVDTVDVKFKAFPKHGWVPVQALPLDNSSVQAADDRERGC
jgi:hypothetical protein